MTISTLPTPPSRADDPSNFSSKSDALLGGLPAFVTEANALQTDVNAKQATASAAATTATTQATNASTSATNAASSATTASTAATTATTQATTATTQAGIATTQAGISTAAASAAASSAASIAGGPVTSVNGKTGIAVLLPSDIAANASQAEMEAGSETSIRSMSPLRVKQAIAALVAPVGNHEVVTHTGNGYASTNTKIRRFTTTLTNVGTAITYADSASLGASFTINETGLYSMMYADATNGSSIAYGISVNSSELTTSIDAITISSRICGPVTHYAGFPAAASRVARLTAGDVIRPHANAAASPATSSLVFFAIRKVAS